MKAQFEIVQPFRYSWCGLCLDEHLYSMPFLLQQGISGALAVLMRDAIRPNLMQTLEVRSFIFFMCLRIVFG